MALDVVALRADTPGAAHVTHLNNAGSSLPSRQVLEAQVEWLETEAVTGGYELAAARGDQAEQVYGSLADLVGGHPDEIAITDHATTAWWQAFHSVPMGAGQRVLTSEVDYGANFIAYLRAAERTGVTIEVVPSDASGQLDVAELERTIAGDVALVAVSHMPTNGGLVNPAAEIGRVTRAAGVPYLLDACQTVGQAPIDVEAIGCDFLSATGRKYLRAPRGTGFLWARRSTLDWAVPLLLDHSGAAWSAPDTYRLRDDARRFETWERNHAAVAGLGVAAGLVNELGIDAIWERVQSLADTLRTRLEQVGATVHDLGRVRGGIVTFTVPDRTATAVRDHLATQQINVSVSTPDATLVDATRRGLGDLVRASVHYYNTEEELDAAVGALTR